MFSHIALDSDIKEQITSSHQLAERLRNYVFENSKETYSINNQSSKEEKSQMIIYRQLLPLAERIDILLSDIQELQELCKDQNSKETEMVEMAEQDLASNVVELNDCLKEASSILLPDHSFDAKSAVLEVQAGAGGNEASLFAEEIFNLYIGLAAQNFQVEVESIDKHQGGEGIDKCTARINGKYAFQYFKYECGVHRVQRVPKASTGNKSDTACRIVHIPTGLSINCQEFKSQAQNEKKARQQVRSFLYQQNYEEQMKKTNAFRKSQIGNMNRNE